MLRIHQLSITPDDELTFDDAALRRLCAKRLGVAENRILCLRVVKRSIDARRDGVRIVYTADVSLKDSKQESTLVKKFKPNEAALLSGRADDPIGDVFSMRLQPWPADELRPVVIGAGPAGLFCALALAVRGARPLLLERGKPVEERAKDIEALEANGILNEESNVLFGEGGAGAFSDGKLTCGLNSPLIRTVLQTLYTCGAPEDITTAALPHIGTDELRKVLANLRRRLIELGAEIRFNCRVSDFVLKNGHVQALRTICGGTEEEIPAEKVFLAIGHSARDTVERLFDLGMPMEQKPFAAGVRIEHLQSEINRAQYGAAAGHKALPAAVYKLNVHTPDARGVYTFCMCPGGQVINASSEAGGVNVNGMSLHARAGRNANAALLVGVRPQDFGSDHPLAGFAWQRKIEQAAFARSGDLRATCQTVGDFLKKRETVSFGAVQPSYKPGVIMGELDGILPPALCENMRFALPQLGRRLRGFDDPQALLTGPETRSSSPVRMLRNERLESPIGGIYPLGEGAGYAGGIVSAAVDGLRAGMGEE